MRFGTILFHAVRVAATLAVGVAVLFYLIRTKPKPESTPRENPGPLVEVLEARRGTEKFTVSGQGTVAPKRAANLVAEVGGRILSRDRKLEAGARFEKGALLFQIDPEDLRLKAEQLQGQIAQTQAEMAQLEAERKNTDALRAIAARETQIAVRDYERSKSLLSKGTVAQEEAEKTEKTLLQSRTVLQNHDNVLRMLPERMKLLDAKLAVARSSLKGAERDLERTAVRAPFAGRVETVAAEAGEFVQTGAQLARMWDDSAVEVRVNLQQEEVRWVIPAAGADDARVREWIGGELELDTEIPDWLPRAEVTYAVGTAVHSWPGFVRGFDGQAERQTRTIPAVVEIRDPWKAAVGGERPPLLPGTFSRVAIEGRVVEDLYRIPRRAVQLDGSVWAAQDGKLAKRGLRIVRTAGQSVYATAPEEGDADASGAAPLAPGDLIVLTQLGAPVEGMPVRLLAPAAVEERTTAPL